MKRILLVDEDRALSGACEADLRGRGFRVVTAEDAEQALRAARSEPPDLVLLDMLGDRVSGVAVLRALRADPRTERVPVLMLASSSKDQDVQEVTRLGAIGCVAKATVSPEELGRRVSQIVSRT